MGNLYGVKREVHCALKRSLKIEKKIFWFDLSRGLMQIKEKSKSTEISTEVELQLIKWLIDKLEEANSIERRVGFLGSKRGSASNLMISIRSNKGGEFLSVLWFSASCTRGFKMLCIPKGRGKGGWMPFRQTLLDVLMYKEGRKEMVVHRRFGNEKVAAPVVSNERVEEIRGKGLVAEAENLMEDRDLVLVKLKEALKMEGFPEVAFISKKWVLLEFRNTDDRNQCLELRSFNVGEETIRFSSWTPGFDTISGHLLSRAIQWVLLFGIPYHLATFKTVEELVKNFRVFDRHSDNGVTINGLPGFKVRVRECDLHKIPQFLPLMDQGGRGSVPH